MVSIIEILQDLSIPYRTEGNPHCRQGWVQLDCPACGQNSGKFHLGISLQGHFTNCYRCGSKSLTDVLMLSSRQSYTVIRDLLKGVVSEHVEKIKKTGKLVIPVGIGELQSKHIKYLKKRGFDPGELQRLWKIQGIGLHKDLAWRIYIPIHYQGEVVSWTTRSLRSEGLRYRNARDDEESLPAKSILYGEDYVRHTIIVNEGHPDVWAIGPGAVATGGLTYTRAQLLKISKYPVRVVAFDNEIEAQKRAKVLCNELELFPGKTVNVCFSCKDAAETMAEKPEEIEEFRSMFLE